MSKNTRNHSSAVHVPDSQSQKRHNVLRKRKPKRQGSRSQTGKHLWHMVGECKAVAQHEDPHDAAPYSFISLFSTAIIHMAYVPVPKDLTRVKTKFLFNLTKRQVFCFGLGALVGVPLFFVTKDTMGSSMAALIMIAAMMPFFMFAIYEQHGQPLEVLLQHYIQARFVRPRTRVYQTENFYATIDQNIRTRREVKKILHGKSPH